MLVAAVASLVGFTVMLGVRHGRFLVARVLDDRDRYLSAVEPLGGDVRFHRLAGAAVAARLRRAGAGALAPVAERFTVATMGLPGFAPGWALLQRGVHRWMRMGDSARAGDGDRRALRPRSMAGLVVLGAVLHPARGRSHPRSP